MGNCAGSGIGSDPDLILSIEYTTNFAGPRFGFYLHKLSMGGDLAGIRFYLHKEFARGPDPILSTQTDILVLKNFPAARA